jgi:hypothetical protein
MGRAPAARGAEANRRPGGEAASAFQGMAERQRVEAALDSLGNEVRTLRVDYERFFGGGLPTPPEELRLRIAQRLRDLRGANLAVAEGFRLAALEAQFHSYQEMYGRRLRGVEEGRGPRQREQVAEGPRHDAVAGIAIGQELEPAAVAALFAGLYQGSQRGAVADLDTFRAYLGQQLGSIRQKTGCAEVQFRVATEDGKLKLKARPLPRSGGAQ